MIPWAYRTYKAWRMYQDLVPSFYTAPNQAMRNAYPRSSRQAHVLCEAVFRDREHESCPAHVSKIARRPWQLDLAFQLLSSHLDRVASLWRIMNQE
jgi:hypothetical protein